MINSEMEIEKLEVWNGPSRPPYLRLYRNDILIYLHTYIFTTIIMRDLDSYHNLT